METIKGYRETDRDLTKHSTRTLQKHYKTHCCYYCLSDNVQEGLNMARISVHRILGFLPELLEHCLVKGTWYHIPHRNSLRIIKIIQASTFLPTWEQEDTMMNMYWRLTLADGFKSIETFKYVHIVMELVISFIPEINYEIEKHYLLVPFSCS